MIKATEILSRSEYDYIQEVAYSQSCFEHKKDFEQFDFEIHSSHFTCDNVNFKNGDYFVGISFNKHSGNYAGFRHPIVLSEFYELFETYEKSLEYIGSLIKKYVEIDTISKIIETSI